jgi:peptidyl-prolyl cis-trans isomerase A (cyclophilin A)
MSRGREMTCCCASVVALLALCTSSLMGAGPAPAPADEKPVVVLDTTAGPIAIELDAEKAPITVKNFLEYVDKGFYNGLVFHRVIPGFMIQGGGIDEEMNDKSEDKQTIKNESDNGLRNARGTIAMARKGHPDSASCQFYINVKDNANLDGGRAPTGYTVFGKVIEGMDTVDKIVSVPRTTKRAPDGMVYENMPVKPVVIKSAKRKAKS